MCRIKDLLRKVDAATGPSFALDIELALTLVPQIVVMKQRSDDTGSAAFTYRKFTSSVDDAIWLSETLLPDFGWEVASKTAHIKACLNPEFGEPIGKYPHWGSVAKTTSRTYEDAATPALALLRSILVTLIASGKAN